MIMKANLLLIASGVILGLIISALFRPHRPVHVVPEYFIELKQDGSAVIEGLDRHTYECPLDSIPSVLLRDNL